MKEAAANQNAFECSTTEVFAEFQLPLPLGKNRKTLDNLQADFSKIIMREKNNVQDEKIHTQTLTDIK